MNIAFFFVSLYAFAADCELSAYPAPHFWLSVFWVRGIQEFRFAYKFNHPLKIDNINYRNDL